MATKFGCKLLWIQIYFLQNQYFPLTEPEIAAATSKPETVPPYYLAAKNSPDFHPLMFDNENSAMEQTTLQNWHNSVQPLALVHPNVPRFPSTPLKALFGEGPAVRSSLDHDIEAAKARLQRFKDDNEEVEEVFYEASPVFPPPEAPGFEPTLLTESLKPCVEAYITSHMDRPLLPDDAPLVLEDVDGEFDWFPLANLVDLASLDYETTLLRIWEYELNALDGDKSDFGPELSFGARLTERFKVVGSFIKRSVVGMTEEEYFTRYPWSQFTRSPDEA